MKKTEKDKLRLRDAQAAAIRRRMREILTSQEPANLKLVALATQTDTDETNEKTDYDALEQFEAQEHMADLAPRGSLNDRYGC